MDENLMSTIPEQFQTLAALESMVLGLIESHESRHERWFPSDLLGDIGNQDSIHPLRERARKIPRDVRVALALNLLTEEGLPHFHRLIASRLGEETFWQKWNNMWTAEENRHALVLRDYCKATGIFNMGNLERMQFSFLREGFDPKYERSPYVVFVYSTLQERATQIAHSRTGHAANEYEPTLNMILEKVAADEARHFMFYRRVFSEILKLDPVGALSATEKVFQAFDMPGRNIPQFSDMSTVVRRSGIYGPRDYLEILNEQIRYWKIDSLCGLDEIGKRKQQQILDWPRKFTRLIELYERGANSQDSAFTFLSEREAAE